MNHTCIVGYDNAMNVFLRENFIGEITSYHIEMEVVYFFNFCPVCGKNVKKVYQHLDRYQKCLL